MLLKSELQDFFSSNSIDLECEKSLTVDEVNNLVLKAGDRGRSLAAFVMMTVINSDRTGINPCFRTVEDLYDAYCSFMIGYIRAQRKDNGIKN